MTGAGTDIGLTIGRIFIGDYKEAWKLKVLIPLLVSFLFGGYTSVFAYKQLGQLTLMVNVLVFFLIGVAYSIIVGRQMHIPFWRALFGWYTSMESQIKESAEHVSKAAKKVQQKMVTFSTRVQLNPIQHKRRKSAHRGMSRSHSISKSKRDSLASTELVPPVSANTYITSK